MDVPVKQEPLDYDKPAQTNQNGDVPNRLPVICLTSSDSDSEPDSDDEANVRGVLSRLGKRSGALDAVEGKLSMKRMKLDELGVVLPDGFLDPLPQPEALPAPEPTSKIVAEKRPSALSMDRGAQSCKQFWKAGDYEGGPSGDWETYSSGMDHVRVHPKFLHSNATSHKWALGAFAELLDNALDEVCNGATYVNVDVQKNIKDGSRMLLIEDNGGGMDPDRMRQCMSLGYSAKSKVANTIGQYGNGFKTSTMRLGADVIVFSRCHGKNGKSPTQSIGLLSYTFLRGTGKEDIVVPMLDYELRGRECSKMIRTTVYDWDRNAETILQWSPFSSEADLIRQFDMLKDHGTRIFIYNLWEDDQGLLELDFDADPHDIQVRGVNRDEKNIQKAEQFPNSKHFLTYRHSLKSYVSILYLRLPPGFRIILRGKDVEHHNIVNDMMLTQEVTYRPQPQPGADGVPKDTNMLAVVTIGFVKDARHHIDVQGFNVYHKNRLIKPFWRLWNAAGSDGRGVIGVLEANFVEPAHDKQGFERTTVLARLEARLVQMQKTYWSTYCDKIGYAARRSKKHSSETSPDHLPSTSGKFKNKGGSGSKFPSRWNAKHGGKGSERSLSCASDGLYQNGHLSGKKGSATKSQFTGSSSEQSYYSDEDDMIGDTAQVVSHGKSIARKSSGKYGSLTALQSKEDNINQLMEENHELKARLKKREDEIVKETLQELQDERERCKSLEMQLNEARRKVEELNKEQESLIDIFSEERDRRDIEEENLRNKLKEASNTIQELLDKVRLLEKLKSPTCKTER